MENINRSVFLRYIDCPVLAWVSKRKKVRQEQGLNDELLFLEWKNVRQKAALLFPEAISARRQDKDNNSSQQITSEIIQNPQNKTILDASFAIDGFCARADVLQRIDDGSWDLFSIKTGRKSKLKYIWDLAFTAMVLLKAGLKINETAVMHISGEYRLGMDISKLFYFASCTSRAESIAVDFLSIADEALKILQSDEMPKPIFKRQCKNCLLFEECFEGKTKDTIFDLPRLSVPAMDELIEKGITTIEEVPDDFELTPAQKIVKDCVKSKTNYISPTLKSKIEAIEPPYYYLDFESITTILPLYPDIAPHTQIVTQFSIHKCLSIDNVADHFEYIADPKFNDQQILACKLIDSLGDIGSIITYSNSEKNSIIKLAQELPEFSPKLLQIVERIVDFEEIIRKNYYDIAFQGHSSIKIVLPILVKDMNYDSLEIAQGGDAAAAFAFMAMGLYDEEQCRQTKENLLKYCAQDTLAMVKIHKSLIDLVSKTH